MKQLQDIIIKCKKCKTTRQIKTPHLGLGNLNARVMFIAERPGYHTSIIHGITLAGNKSGDFFMKCLEHINVSINEIYITNIVKCQAFENKTPTDIEIGACSEYLLKEIKIIKPKCIVLMGNTALRSFFPEQSVLKISGEILYSFTKQTKFYILPHPAWALRFDKKSQYKEWFWKIKEFI